MRTTRRPCLAYGVIALVAVMGAHCSSESQSGASASDAGAPPTDPPTVHRAVAAACAATRAAVLSGPASADAGAPAGSCKSDADCTAGKNGRCVSSRTTSCTYDECFTDDDCGAGRVCHCGEVSTNGYRPGHRCVASDCRVDADCATGFCSPTLDPQCGSYAGVSGYYCHTPKDACHNDSGCNGVGQTSGTVSGSAFCGFQPTTRSWSCSRAMCLG